MSTWMRRTGWVDLFKGPRCDLLIALSALPARESIPPWLIFKTFPTESWAEVEADEAIHFTRSETGFLNSEISFEWLHHFNLRSWRKSAQAQRSGLAFEEYFGCDIWLRDPERPWSPRFEVPPVQRPDDEQILYQI